MKRTYYCWCASVITLFCTLHTVHAGSHPEREGKSETIYDRKESAAYTGSAYIGDASIAEHDVSSVPSAMTARLIDAKKNAKQHTVIVDVQVSGIQLIDPMYVTNKSDPTQAHLHYQVDNGVVIATPSSKMSFHGLVTGRHHIAVQLANAQHAAVGAQADLFVTIP